MIKRLLTGAFAAVLIGGGLAGTAALAATGVGAAAAPTVPDFSICPPVRAYTGGCNTVIVINASGSPTVYENPAEPGHYDGIEDTLVGVQNVSGRTIDSLPLSGKDIFGFEGDGLCQFIACDYPHPTTYEGPNTTFTIVDPDNGSVNFTGGLAAGATAYFSLESFVTSSSLILDAPILATGVTATTTVGFSGTVANFTYDGNATADGFTATIDWGNGGSTSAGVVSGTAPNFAVSGTHTFAATGTYTVTVTIQRHANPTNQAVATSTFTVTPACATACVETLTIPGVQSSQVIALGATNVSQSAGQDPGFGCSDTFLHTPLVVTVTSSGGSRWPKLVAATVDKSQVAGNAVSRFHICYGRGAAFTDLYGNPVPAGGTGLLPFCTSGRHLSPPPCELPSFKLKGNVVEPFLTPGSDPKYH